MNVGMVKTFTAGGAVTKRRFCKFDGSADVIQCTADTDAIIGVSDQVGDVADGERIDVHMSGQPEVEAGAAIAAGASVSCDASGKAKTAQAGDVAAGFAVEAADEDGDIITVHLARHTV